MTPWLISLVITFVGWGVAYLFERIGHGKTREALAEEKLAVAFARADAEKATRNFDLAAEDVERLRALLTAKLEEIDALSFELAHCNIPGAAADRIKRLLSGQH
jgi:hypothetical protein